MAVGSPWWQSSNWRFGGTGAEGKEDSTTSVTSRRKSRKQAEGHQLSSEAETGRWTALARSRQLDRLRGRHSGVPSVRTAQKAQRASGSVGTFRSGRTRARGAAGFCARKGKSAGASSATLASLFEKRARAVGGEWVGVSSPGLLQGARRRRRRAARRRGHPSFRFLSNSIAAVDHCFPVLLECAPTLRRPLACSPLPTGALLGLAADQSCWLASCSSPALLVLRFNALLVFRSRHGAYASCTGAQSVLSAVCTSHLTQLSHLLRS